MLRNVKKDEIVVKVEDLDIVAILVKGASVMFNHTSDASRAVGVTWLIEAGVRIQMMKKEA